MKYSTRVQIFKRVKADHAHFLTSVLWKLTGDTELFTEAMQYALLGMWQHIEKLNGKKTAAYIYRIALSANSKAWRNRIGRDGQISQVQFSAEKNPGQKVAESDMAQIVRQTIAKLPAKQSKALVMRYFQQHDYEGIAEKLRCSEAGARSHVSKALANLKSKLATLKEGSQ